jgi:hypothetical protein
MAFQTQKVVVFALGESYRGPTAVVQFDFPFVFFPGIDPIDQLNAIVQVGLFSLSIVPEIRNNYLSYELAVDDKPGFTPDQYQVTVIVAGETQEASGTIGPVLAGQPMGWTAGRPLARVSARRGRLYAQAFIGPVLLVAVAVAIGILLVFAAITYKIFNGSWGPGAVGWGIILPIALVAGGVYLVASGALGGRQRSRAVRGA